MLRAPGVPSASIVVTLRAPTVLTGVTHARTGLPSRWTVHAPHWAMPQPNFVPLRSRTSRNTHSRGMSAGTSTGDDFPLTFNVNDMVYRSPWLSGEMGGDDAARVRIDLPAPLANR